MQSFDIKLNEEGLHIEGLPDAVIVVCLEGPKAKQMAHMALHRKDLRFALNSLDAINRVPVSDDIIREALWRSALVSFSKCFVGGSARMPLVKTHVYVNEPTGKIVFDYFKNLRDKHVIHDENAYSHCLPAAALNDGTKPFMVA